MKSFTVRTLSLYTFNLVVLLAVGILMPQVRVGFALVWAAAVLTLVTLFVKPLLSKWFSSVAARSAGSRSKGKQKAVEYLVVFLVALAIWLLTVAFSGVYVRGFFWGYAIPPVVLLIAWVIYDRIDDKIEAKAAEAYDAVNSQFRGGSSGKPEVPTAPPAQSAAGRDELKDGLTPEQRRMLDELG